MWTSYLLRNLLSVEGITNITVISDYYFDDEPACRVSFEDPNKIELAAFEHVSWQGSTSEALKNINQEFRGYDRYYVTLLELILKELRKDFSYRDRPMGDMTNDQLYGWFIMFCNGADINDEDDQLAWLEFLTELPFRGTHFYIQVEEMYNAI